MVGESEGMKTEQVIQVELNEKVVLNNGKMVCEGFDLKGVENQELPSE